MKTELFKVVLVGPESSGTTTLSKQLANLYNTVWVPEFGRFFSEGVGPYHEWTVQDFILIAAQQNRMESIFEPLARTVIVCDTDSLATRMWEQRYLGSMSKEVEAISNEFFNRCKPDAYILTVPDFPYVQDGTRDGDDEARWNMYLGFREMLKLQTVPWKEAHGHSFQRVSPACEFINDLYFSRKWGEEWKTAGN